MTKRQTIKIEKKIHRGYLEWEKAKEEYKFRLMFGKYQYFYSSEKGEISLIQLKNYSAMNRNFWEIYSFKGNLLEDVEKFDTKKQAEKRIFNLL